MEKHKDVVSILSKLNLDDIEETISEPYHQSGSGRPPRKPLGIFKALMVKHLRNICDIEPREKPYNPSQMTRFREKVGPERLENIIHSLVEELVVGGVIKGDSVSLDATFIKAWSKRDPVDDSHGFSDPESRVGRDVKTYELGYKAQVAVDSGSICPWLWWLPRLTRTRRNTPRSCSIRHAKPLRV
jgi:hypothetical protein